MLTRKFLGLLGTFLTLGTLSLVLSGCGGDTAPKPGPDGEIESAPIVNATPEALEPETGSNPD